MPENNENRGHTVIGNSTETFTVSSAPSTTSSNGYTWESYSISQGISQQEEEVNEVVIGGEDDVIATPTNGIRSDGISGTFGEYGTMSRAARRSRNSVEELAEAFGYKTNKKQEKGPDVNWEQFDSR